MKIYFRLARCIFQRQSKLAAFTQLFYKICRSNTLGIWESLIFNKYCPCTTKVNRIYVCIHVQKFLDLIGLISIGYIYRSYGNNIYCNKTIGWIMMRKFISEFWKFSRWVVQPVKVFTIRISFVSGLLLRLAVFNDDKSWVKAADNHKKRIAFIFALSNNVVNMKDVLLFKTKEV